MMIPFAESAESIDRTEQGNPTAGYPARRVLHVINGEHYSGAERVQDLLAERLPDCGFATAFACVKPDRFPQRRKSRWVPAFATPMKSKWDLRPVLHLVGLVREGRFDLMHAHTPRTALVAAIAATICRVPLVYHVHSPAGRDSTHPWQNRLNAIVEHISLTRAAALIAVSQSLGERLRHWRRFRDRVFVVPNGVPCAEPRPVRAPGDKDWTLGTVALFRPRKGLEVLLESLAILARRATPVRLRAVGDFETTSYRQQILARADGLGLRGAVEWTGFTRDVGRQLFRMDVFILPSLFGEGLPMVVLEAMAAGVPVVATRVEGIPEAIRDGQDGLLVEPNNPCALAEAIARFVSGQVDWSAMSSSALKRHAQHFSDEAMAAGVAEVYRRVLAARAEKG